MAGNSKTDGWSRYKYNVQRRARRTIERMDRILSQQEAQSEYSEGARYFSDSLKELGFNSSNQSLVQAAIKNIDFVAGVVAINDAAKSGKLGDLFKSSAEATDMVKLYRGIKEQGLSGFLKSTMDNTDVVKAAKGVKEDGIAGSFAKAAKQSDTYALYQGVKDNGIRGSLKISMVDAVSKAVAKLGRKDLRDRYDGRSDMKTAIEKMNRMDVNHGFQSRAILRYRNQLQDMLDSTYGRAKNDHEREEHEKRIRRLENRLPLPRSGSERTRKAAEFDAKNKAFSQQINIARHPEKYGAKASTLGKYSFVDSMIFLDSVKGFMGNTDLGDTQTERILSGISGKVGYRVDSLEEAWRLTLARNRGNRNRFLRYLQEVGTSGVGDDISNNYEAIYEMIDELEISRW